MSQPRADYDTPWQEVLERYFRECLALFLPRAHAEIDWSRKPVFLDKELRQVTPAPRPPILGVSGSPRVGGVGGASRCGGRTVRKPGC